MATLIYMLANHQIRHPTTCTRGCQPGDCRWIFLRGLCGHVWVNCHSNYYNSIEKDQLLLQFSYSRWLVSDKYCSNQEDDATPFNSKGEEWCSHKLFTTRHNFEATIPCSFPDWYDCQNLKLFCHRCMMPAWYPFCQNWRSIQWGHGILKISVCLMLCYSAWSQY